MTGKSKEEMQCEINSLKGQIADLMLNNEFNIRFRNEKHFIDAFELFMSTEGYYFKKLIISYNRHIIGKSNVDETGVLKHFIYKLDDCNEAIDNVRADNEERAKKNGK